MLSENRKKEFILRADESLNEAFDGSLYYTLALFGIIDYSNHYEKYFDEIMNIPDEKPSKQGLFYSGEANLTALNEFLNFKFKLGIGNEKEFVTKFSAYSPYYKWILNLDEFDYKEFDPHWILEYPTNSFLIYIFASSKVKEYLKEYLRWNNQPILSSYYVKYS